jgi:hypothetical protein
MPDLSLWVRDFPHYRDVILAQHEPGSEQQCPVCRAKVGDVRAEHCRRLRAAREAACPIVTDIETTDGRIAE